MTGARRWRSLVRSWSAILGATALVVIFLGAALAPVLSPTDPYEQNLRNRLIPPLGEVQEEHRSFLGTDALGRDVYSRVVYGARISLLVALLSGAIALGVGTAVGLYAGYYGGVLDSFVMRAVDLQLAFPFVLLALAILSIIGASVRNVILLFVVTSWPVYARVVRGAVLSLREESFVEAARALGVPGRSILARHLLPNCLGPLLVICSFEIARMMMMEATLSYLGLGVPPPIPTWGNMIAEGRAYIRTAWWLTAIPGIALMITVLSVNLVGDALRDAIGGES